MKKFTKKLEELSYYFTYKWRAKEEVASFPNVVAPLRTLHFLYITKMEQGAKE